MGGRKIDTRWEGGSEKDVGELIIPMRICYFGKRKKEPSDRRPFFSDALSVFSLSFSSGEREREDNEGADVSNFPVGRIPSATGGLQVQSARVLRIRGLVIDLSALRPLHSLEFPARRMDNMERSHLVSQSVHAPLSPFFRFSYLSSV